MSSRRPPIDWGLRDYGTARWEGGDPDCDHKKVADPAASVATSTLDGGKKSTGHVQEGFKKQCGRCGARRVDRQIGLEPTPADFVEAMVVVFREVRRVLRSDGTCWVNLGDSYANDGKWGGSSGGKHVDALHGSTGVGRGKRDTGLKPKDLVGIPWRVAFALQADGWWLRSDVIWAKPNPMPESVTDRPTRAHEYLFLFAKGQWTSRRVKFADLADQSIHLGSDGSNATSTVGRATRLCVVLATALFDLSQRESDFRLPPLDAQVWQQGADSEGGDFVCGLPSVHRPAVWAARLLTGHATPERFLEELHRLRCDLADGNRLLVGGIQTEGSLAPGIHRDADGAIAVNDAGHVGKIDFVHKRIIVSEPSTCTYFYDADAIREPHLEPWRSTGALENRGTKDVDAGANNGFGLAGVTPREYNPLGRNKRSVWTIATEPYPDAHFATFPTALVEPCVLAGCPGKTCPSCGAPWERVVERRLVATRGKVGDHAGAGRSDPGDAGSSFQWNGGVYGHYDTTTLGWEPSCDCGNCPERKDGRHEWIDGADICARCGCDWEHRLPEPVPGVVLDPFAGSGTTLLVALRHGRRGIGIELNPKYVEMASRRIFLDCPMFNGTPQDTAQGLDRPSDRNMPLFDAAREVSR